MMRWKPWLDIGIWDVKNWCLDPRRGVKSIAVYAAFFSPPSLSRWDGGFLVGETVLSYFVRHLFRSDPYIPACLLTSAPTHVSNWPQGRRIMMMTHDLMWLWETAQGIIGVILIWPLFCICLFSSPKLFMLTTPIMG